MASSAVSQGHSGQLLHHPPAAGAGSMMARVERLDLVVGYLEEMRHGHSARSASTSPSNSTPTTFSSSSPPATPPRSTNRCRPAEELLRETRAKGSLVDRIAFLETRVLRMEEERLTSASRVELCTPERTTGRLSSAGGDGGSGSTAGSGRKKKGLKSLVKSCVRAGAKLKTKD